MKLTKLLKSLLLTVVVTVIIATTVNLNHAQAQEITPGVDLYSTYVWRGVSYSGPSIQPYVELSSGGFALGAWGSQGIDGSFTDGSSGFQEMDLYASYSFDFGLSLGVTDYYYPGGSFFEDTGHAFEFNAGLALGDLSLSGNYIFAGEGSYGDDMYFEVGYSAGPANVFVGGGDGWHSSDPEEFAIVNIGIGTSKEIKITDSFSLPLSGAVILNPDTEQFYIVAGISL
ncbi:MAG: TorF family putative porin [Balneolaceae bacterium]|nr:TorF family putative porin [Balneolaceae bacterium]